MKGGWGCLEGAWGRSSDLSFRSPHIPNPPKSNKPQRHCQRLRLEGGVRQEVDLFFGDRHLLCSSFWGSRRPTSSNLLAPGPPPFISSFIPACLFGVGLKGAGWTRTENDISTRTSSTQSRANKRRGAYGCCLDLMTCLAKH